MPCLKGTRRDNRNTDLKSLVWKKNRTPREFQYYAIYFQGNFRDVTNLWCRKVIGRGLDARISNGVTYNIMCPNLPRGVVTLGEGQRNCKFRVLISFRG
jgi:hypothetical protein